jgi:hypothetical protein
LSNPKTNHLADAKKSPLRYTINIERDRITTRGEPISSPKIKAQRKDITRGYVTVPKEHDDPGGRIAFYRRRQRKIN